MTVEAFKPEHLAQIELQPAQSSALAHVPAGYAEQLAAAGPAITVRSHGRILACLGIGWPTANERLLWGFLAAQVSPWRIFSAARALIAEHGQEPLYATVENGFEQGERALELLNFVRDEPLPAFGFDGRDHTLFV